MFTYTLDRPRRPIAQALNATVIHASLIAGAVWATTPITTVRHPSHEVIDLGGVIEHRPPACRCVVSKPNINVLLATPDLPPLVPIVGPVTPPVGIRPVDARSLVIADSSLLATGLGADSGVSSSIFDEAVVDEIPTVMVAGQLRYPAVQREAGIEGAVTLSYVIDTEGRVESDGIEVVRATLPAFIPAAEEAVQTSRFHPAMKHHQAVRVRVRQTVTFSR